MKFKTVPVTFKTEAEGLTEGEFIVYPSTFTRTPDAYGDVVAKGAFLKGIEKRKATGHQLPGLFAHRMDDLDAYVAYALDEGEDEKGWWVKGAFDLDDPAGRKLHRLVKGGRIRELSFAYDTLDSAQVTLADGTKANELRDLDVFEFSFVPVGANRDTSIVAVKSATDALAVAPLGPLAKEHIDSLRAAQEAITAVLAAAVEPDQEKASGQTEANDEEPATVKSDEPGINPSAAALAKAKYALTL